MRHHLVDLYKDIADYPTGPNGAPAEGFVNKKENRQKSSIKQQAI